MGFHTFDLCVHGVNCETMRANGQLEVVRDNVDKKEVSAHKLSEFILDF